MIVFPAPVGAATRTELPASTASSAWIWNGSGVKLSVETQRARRDEAACASALYAAYHWAALPTPGSRCILSGPGRQNRACTARGFIAHIRRYCAQVWGDVNEEA